MSFGTLYVVPTPIGNLEDITLRALRILSQVAVLAAEDTRSAHVLLEHHGLWPLATHRQLLSYFEGNEAQRTKQLLACLQAGQSVALLSEAGVPAISDPGHRMVQAAIQVGISVDVLPGPNACITALVGSGLDPSRFLFVGFPPRQEQKRIALFASFKHDPATVVLYEAPVRVLTTLQELTSILDADRQVCVARELTKQYQEYKRGTLAALCAYYQTQPVRGEVTLVVAGATETERSTVIEIEQEIEKRLLLGQGPKTVAAAISLQTGKPKRQIYQLCLLLQKKTGQV